MNFAHCFEFLILIIQLSFSDTCPSIVRRKEWGGLQPLHVRYLLRPVALVIIQHTVSPTCHTDDGCSEIVRSIQSYHMETLDHWDIGQSFLIGGHGKVYEGRGWLHEGAHTLGYNKKSIGISFIGNFNRDEPTPQALDAAKSLIKCGVEQGHLDSYYDMVGQRQIVAVTSPGRKLYDVIKRWPGWLEDVSSIRH